MYHSNGVNIALIVLSSILFAIITLPILSKFAGNSLFKLNRQLTIFNSLLTTAILICSIVSIAKDSDNGSDIAILILSFVLLYLLYKKFASANNVNNQSFYDGTTSMDTFPSYFDFIYRINLSAL